MTDALKINPKHTSVLDPGFVPAVLWNRACQERVARDAAGQDLHLALTRPDGTVFRHAARVLTDSEANRPLNLRYTERLLKFLLWMKGGSRVLIAGSDTLAGQLAKVFSSEGARAFDDQTVGRKIFLDEGLRVEARSLGEMPAESSVSTAVGRNLDGCRIGFDLGGSDRKCAAVVDGEVVHSEEVEWNPYFESDPNYHFEGIMDSLRRAAKHLPRVDAIGGSSAGVYVNNEPRVASLFRGVSDQDFDLHVRPMFRRVREAWANVPFEIANDGEVTALAASMSLNDNAVLGISMGTSLAAGYCDADGRITSWLNELAFVPVDYAEAAPPDEWSGDLGCGVQCFSQQAVARLAPLAGLEYPDEMPLPERLSAVQALMKNGDERARRIFETIGVYFGYSVAWFAEFYEIRHLLILGRVTSGEGGEIVIEKGKHVLADEFPELAERIKMTTPDEQFKRHGQAIAAASLPSLS